MDLPLIFPAPTPSGLAGIMYFPRMYTSAPPRRMWAAANYLGRMNQLVGLVQKDLAEGASSVGFGTKDFDPSARSALPGRWRSLVACSLPLAKGSGGSGPARRHGSAGGTKHAARTPVHLELDMPLSVVLLGVAGGGRTRYYDQESIFGIGSGKQSYRPSFVAPIGLINWKNTYVLVGGS